MALMCCKKASTWESLSCLSVLRFKSFQGLKKDLKVRPSGREKGKRDTEKAGLLQFGSWRVLLFQTGLCLLFFTSSPSLAHGLHSVFMKIKQISVFIMVMRSTQRKKTSTLVLLFFHTGGHRSCINAWKEPEIPYLKKAVWKTMSVNDFPDDRENKFSYAN